MVQLKSPGSARPEYHDNVRYDILHLIDKNPGRVLDVGGGTGATSAYLKRHLNAQYAAVIDNFSAKPQSEIDRFIRKNLDDDKLWEKLCEDEARFDTVLCLDVLEHLVDPWTVVKKCSQLLNPNGTLIVSLPNARNYQLTFPLFFKGQFELKNSGIMDRTHLRWFVKRSAMDLVRCGGLSLESCSGGWYMNRYRWWERAALFGITPGFLFQIYYLKARKPFDSTD